MDDELFWLGNDSGDLIVKPAYSSMLQANGSNPDLGLARDPIWRYIWNAKVAPKVKIFFVEGVAWYFANNGYIAVPTY